MPVWLLTRRLTRMIYVPGALFSVNPVTARGVPQLFARNERVACVFEGERAYGGSIFECTQHSERLKRSANILDFEVPYSVAEIDAAKRLVIEKNAEKEAYVRAIAWRGSEQLGVSASQNKIHLAIATWEWPSYFDPAQRMKGIRLDLAEYRRPDPRTSPCLAKAAGLYMICTISKHRAERRGLLEAHRLGSRYAYGSVIRAHPRRPPQDLRGQR